MDMGLPPIPDWTQLTALRDRLRDAARQDLIERQKIQLEDLPASKPATGFLELTPLERGQACFADEDELADLQGAAPLVGLLRRQDLEGGKDALAS